MNLYCFLKFMGTQDLLLSIKSKKFHLIFANLVDIFEALNDINWIFQIKNINYINDYDAINALVAKLGLGIVELKMQLSSLN